VKRRTVRYIHEVIEETDDEAFEFTDASTPSFLTELDEDDIDADVPDQPDPVIGFRRTENKEP
jgi:hypothetical protein